MGQERVHTGLHGVSCGLSGERSVEHEGQLGAEDDQAAFPQTIS